MRLKWFCSGACGKPTRTCAPWDFEAASNSPAPGQGDPPDHSGSERRRVPRRIPCARRTRSGGIVRFHRRCVPAARPSGCIHPWRRGDRGPAGPGQDPGFVRSGVPHQSRTAAKRPATRLVISVSASPEALTSGRAPSAKCRSTADRLCCWGAPGSPLPPVVVPANQRLAC